MTLALLAACFMLATTTHGLMSILLMSLAALWAVVGVVPIITSMFSSGQQHSMTAREMIYRKITGRRKGDLDKIKELLKELEMDEDA